MQKPFSSIAEVKKHAKSYTLPLLKSIFSNAKLGHALEFIARDSGFKEWRALKSHLESPPELGDLHKMDNGVFSVTAINWPNTDDLYTFHNFLNQLTTLQKMAESPKYTLEIKADNKHYKKNTWLLGQSKKELIETYLTGGDPIHIRWVAHPNHDNLSAEAIDLSGYWQPVNLCDNWNSRFNFIQFIDFLPVGKKHLAFDKNVPPETIIDLFLQEVIMSSSESGIFLYKDNDLIEDAKSRIAELEICNDHYNDQAHIVRQIKSITNTAIRATTAHESFFWFGDERLLAEHKGELYNRWLNTLNVAKKDIQQLLHKHPRRSLNKQSRTKAREMFSLLRLLQRSFKVLH